jgi:hypothetical protein
MKYYFFEQVLTGGTQRLGYSLPDVIADEKDCQELINTIEKDPELNAWVLGDELKDPSSAKRTSADIWAKLSKTPIGTRLKQQYPGIEKYRISSARTSGTAFAPDSYKQQKEGKPETTREIDEYDTWANSNGQHLANNGMPSFKEYSTNSKWRIKEVQGGSSKQSAINVATQKQTPIK